MFERFVDVGSEQGNKATLQKTQRDVKLLQTFLGTWNELRKVEEIPALELNEYISEFIISVGTKDGKDYKPSSLRSLLATFKVAEHSFQEPMPNSPLLLGHLCFGARFLLEQWLTTNSFFFAFWLRYVLLP